MRALFESNAIEGEWDGQSLIDAREAWDYIKGLETIDINDIQIVHFKLMFHKDIKNKYRGDWRDMPVWIGGEFKSQPKIVIQSLMEDFINDINNDIKSNSHELGPIDFHIRFESIHPFIDGNGRVGRILLNWHLLRLDEPFKVFYEEEKNEKYYPLFK